MTATVAGVGSAAARAAACPVEELPRLAEVLLAEVVAAVPGAVSATVVTVAPGPRLRPWARSGPVGVDLDAVQAVAGRGPVLDAVARLDAVVTSDVWTDDRWELVLGGEAGEVRSVLARALPGSTEAPAVLAVHGGDERVAEPAVAELVAVVVPDLAAGVAVLRARQEAANLQRALTSNRVIGAAIGVTMAAHKLTYDAAGELLRALSNHTNTRLADLAEDILLTGELPGVGERRGPHRRPVPGPRTAGSGVQRPAG